MFMLFFFFKQKTAYEMRISEWSSDVCSSDLDAGPVGAEPQAVPGPVVGEDGVPAIFQASIGDDKMGRRNRKDVSRRASRRRHFEDVGVTAERRRPERRTFARRAERRTWESKDPNAGPSPPARQYRRGARRS